MYFTSKKILGSFAGAVLIAASLASIGGDTRARSTPATPTQNNPAVIRHFQMTKLVWMVPAEESNAGFPKARSDYYQPVTAWYKNKHWWKRNAPIIGGAGGGALVGGLLGGGKGAIIGGAVGGGGGYLYKRSKRHHEYHHYK
jgi:hypothetical protein